jgi:hypothetical protein
MMNIRKAARSDIEHMIALSELKRTQEVLPTGMVDNTDSLRDEPDGPEIDTRLASVLTGRGPQRAETALFPLILGHDPLFSLPKRC